MISTPWSTSSFSAGNGNCVQWRKSTHCAGGDCVEFRTSSYCDTSACVEVATHEVVQVRDSKDKEGPVLEFSPDSWMSFISAIKAGEISGRVPPHV